MEDNEEKVLKYYDYFHENDQLWEYHPRNESAKESLTVPIYSHVRTKLLPSIDENEKFVMCWPIYLVWNHSNDVTSVQINVVRELNGVYGTGYIAVTSKAVYLCSFEQLTKTHPLVLKGAGMAVAKFLIGIGGQKDNRKPSKADKNWKVNLSGIKGTKIFEHEIQTRDYIDFNTVKGDWQIFSYIDGFIQEIQTGIIMAIDGRFDDAPSTDNVSQDQLTLIKQLDGLKQAGILSDEEFDDKLRKILNEIE